MGSDESRSIAPWRSLSGQMYVTDRELLAAIAGNAPRTPKELAEGRRRENVLRLQCEYLSQLGLLRPVARDLYDVTGAGHEFLSGSLDLLTDDGYVLLEEELDLPARRITDFESLDPTVVKILNRDEFFDDASHDYGWVQGDPRLTESRIMNVKGWQLSRVIEEFPRFVSLPRQCAHWMRAFVGLHFFPDANHRTGTATLYALLKANDVAPPEGAWPGEDIDEAVLYSKLLRGLVTSVTFDKLWLCDELYLHWEQYFRRLFHDSDDTRPALKTEHLRDVLNYAREKRRRG